MFRYVKEVFVRWASARSRRDLHLLAQNENLAPADYPAIRALIDQAHSLHVDAAKYVSLHGLDPEVFLPGNIWAALHASSGFANWSYDLVNYSRAVSAFSGFHMMLWGRQDLPGDFDPDEAGRFYSDLFSGALTGNAIGERLHAMGIPRKIEQSRKRLFPLYRSRGNLASTYDQLVANVPQRFRIEAPRRGGEMGLLHDGRIVNPDVLTYQGRINALYGSGTLDAIDRVIALRGAANYLEIGPGHCFFACALRSLFGHRLNIYLIDLPFVIANGIAYVSCAHGVGTIGLATQAAWPAQKPFVFIPNYLVPLHERHLPKFDLVHNALSLNEMSAKQVAYYMTLIDEHLTPDGVFHLCGGEKHLEYHQDALGAAMRRLPVRKLYRGNVKGIPVMDRPNSFFESTRTATPDECRPVSHQSR